jgi:hypothetical protein
MEVLLRIILLSVGKGNAKRAKYQEKANSFG